MSLVTEITPCFCNFQPRTQTPTSDIQTPISDFQTPISDFQTPISDFKTPISDFETPTSDFVDQGVPAVLNTTLLFSKRLLLNVTSDRNNPLLL